LDEASELSILLNDRGGGNLAGGSSTSTYRRFYLGGGIDSKKSLLDAMELLTTVVEGSRSSQEGTERAVEAVLSGKGLTLQDLNSPTSPISLNESMLHSTGGGTSVELFPSNSPRAETATNA
jgi:hypothetical protein